MTNSWVPVLAGGVGGAVLTNLAGEWRQWRSNRREDRHRFANEQLQTASDVLRLTAEVQRVHTRLIRTRFSDPAGKNTSNVEDMRKRLSEPVQALDAAAARFEILFPRQQRVAMKRVLDLIDHLTTSIDRREAVSEPTERLREAIDELKHSCRRYIVGTTD